MKEELTSQIFFPLNVNPLFFSLPVTTKLEHVLQVHVNERR